MKKKFKDIEIGEYFGCYGNEFSFYHYPAWLVAVKQDKDIAAEVDIRRNIGIRFDMKETDEVEYYGPWENVDLNRIELEIS
jgi:hypothetical protein